MPDELILATADLAGADLIITGDCRCTGVLVGRRVELLSAAQD